jgi:predicted solute-binding protein
MKAGPQQSLVDLHYAVPSECARRLTRGEADLGIVPVAEAWRNQWDTVPGCCIACDGPVRSILLVTKKPWDQVTTLAADQGSRTSVLLSRVLFARRWGSEPAILETEPRLDAMLQSADAALVIGDAALGIDPESLAYPWLDLGAEWKAMTGLPMVFATWSGPDAHRWPGLEDTFRGSLEFGLEHMEDIVIGEAARRNYPEAVVRKYLRENVRFQLGPRQQEGLQLFLRMAAEIEPAEVLRP